MEVLKQEFLYKGEPFCEVPIELAIEQAHLLDFPIHVPLSANKLVMLDHASKQLIERLKDYQEKGLVGVALKKDDYKTFLERIRQEVKKNYHPEDLKAQYKNLEAVYSSMSKCLGNFGFDEEAVRVVQAVSEEVVKSLQDTPNLYKLLKNLRGVCNEEFLKTLCVSYVTQMMIQTFSWQNPQVIQKVVLGILLCDISLKKNDFTTLRVVENNDELSEQLKAHPLQSALMVREARGYIDKETLDIIEEHHEMPDGSGYPRQLTHTKISQLSSIHITARHFVDLLFEIQFKNSLCQTVFDRMYEKFYEGNFKAAMQSLYQILDQTVPQDMV